MNGDFYNNIALSEVCARMVDDSGRPLKAIAAEIGKAYTTLYRELDQNDEGGKIGVDTLLPLIRACHDAERKSPPTPLLWLAGKLGYRCVPENVQPDKNEVREECLDDIKELAAFQELLRSGSTPVAVVARQAETAIREIKETVEQYRREWETRNG